MSFMDSEFKYDELTTTNQQRPKFCGPKGERTLFVQKKTGPFFSHFSLLHS